MVNPRSIEWDETPIEALPTSKAFWLQALDRAVKTALQALVVFLGVGVPIQEIDIQKALMGVAAMVAVSLAMSLSSSQLYVTENFSVDLVQRAIRTFIATAVGVIVGVEELSSIDWANVWGLAATATVLSLVTNFLTKNVGTKGTASAIKGADIPAAAIVPTVGHAVLEQLYNPYKFRQR